MHCNTSQASQANATGFVRCAPRWDRICGPGIYPRSDQSNPIPVATSFLSGGIGFDNLHLPISVQVFRHFHAVVRTAHDIVANCDCTTIGNVESEGEGEETQGSDSIPRGPGHVTHPGCPFCVQTPLCKEYNSVVDRYAAEILLHRVLTCFDKGALTLRGCLLW